MGALVGSLCWSSGGLGPSPRKDALVLGRIERLRGRTCSSALLGTWIPTALGAATGHSSLQREHFWSIRACLPSPAETPLGQCDGPRRCSDMMMLPHPACLLLQLSSASSPPARPRRLQFFKRPMASTATRESTITRRRDRAREAETPRAEPERRFRAPRRRASDQRRRRHNLLCSSRTTAENDAK